MIRVRGPKDSKGRYEINTTSSSDNWSKGLSPFFLGPCKLYNGYTATNVENAWQYSKVYPEHVDAKGDPTAEYFKWAEAGWSRIRADRYPMGKGNIPLYSYWDGKKLDYIEARKKIYVPLYKKAVAQTYAYLLLVDFYKKNKTVSLFDYDGYDNTRVGLSFEDVLNNPTRKMGHAFVLAMMLLETK